MTDIVTLGHNRGRGSGEKGDPPPPRSNLSLTSAVLCHPGLLYPCLPVPLPPPPPLLTVVRLQSRNNPPPRVLWIWNFWGPQGRGGVGSSWGAGVVTLRW